VRKKPNEQFKCTYMCGSCAKGMQSTELVYIYVGGFIISNTTSRFI